MFELLIMGILIFGYIFISKAKEGAEDSKRKYEKDIEEYEETMHKYGYR